MDRRGLFRKSKRCCGRPPKYITLLFSQAFHLPRCRHTTFDRGEQGEGDTSRDDQLDKAVIDTSRRPQGSRRACSVDSGAKTSAEHYSSCARLRQCRPDALYVLCSIEYQWSMFANSKLRTLLLYRWKYHEVCWAWLSTQKIIQDLQ